MKVKINVTERDIKYGVPESAKRCAVARAMRRHAALRGAWVGVWTFSTEKEGNDIALPDDVIKWIGDFDLPVKPISFTVELG